ncbi:phosphopantetheine-binding protein, partial [Phycicoccus flavus]
MRSTLSTLGAADTEMLRAELRGADFGVLVELDLDPRARDRVEQALAATVAGWPSVGARVLRTARGPVVLDDPVHDVRELAVEDDLRDHTLLASRGDRLLRYRVDGDRLQLLAHHLLLDADSLAALVADLDGHLAGRDPAAAPEWPWDPADGGAPLPRPLPQPAAGAGLSSGTGTPCGGEPVPARRPAPGTHAHARIPSEQADRLAAAARTCGVTPFALHWAAAARVAAATAGPDGTTLGAVVSERLLQSPPRRSGNATAHLSVRIGDHGRGAAHVRGSFEDFVATWRGRRAAAGPVPDQLLVSLAAAPSARGLQRVWRVTLGDYVVKYPRHVQVQVVGGEVVVEAYAETGGGALLAAYLDALDAVVAECVGGAAPVAPAPDAPPAPALPSTGPAGTPEPLAAVDRVVGAAPDTALRDLGITSFDVLTLLDDLGRRFGLRAGVEDFYRWTTAGEVQGAVAAVAAGRGPARSDGRGDAVGGTDGPVAGVVLPHLRDIFVDAVRHEAGDPYAVECAVVLDPRVVTTDVDAVAAALTQVLRRHDGLTAGVGFGPAGVELTPGAVPVPVRRVTADRWDEVRDPRPLRVRRPTHLADVAVCRVGDEVGVYLDVHHLLLDGTGLGVLLEDLARTLRGEDPVPGARWSEVAPALARSQARARQVWADLPAPAGARPVGRPGTVRGGHVRHRVPWGRRDDGPWDFADTLEDLTGLVAEFTGQRRGVVGSVHHGRTVPGADRLVGGLARVLPAHFDLDDPRVVRDTAARL